VIVCVFISHSWAYSGHYEKLSDWIFSTPWQSNDTPVQFINSSVPKNNPIHNAPNSDSLRFAIYNRIAQSNVVVIPTGMYSSHSEWIKKEIDGAILYKKPIVGVNPWGQERKSSIVVEAAHITVGWNADRVVNAIWELRNG